MKDILTVAIMTHPKRLESNHAVNVLYKMTRDCTDQCGQLRVDISVDEESRGNWWNSRECWRMADPAVSMFHMVVPDDISVCRDFHQSISNALHALLEFKGEQPASFFTARSMGDAAERLGHHWSTTDGGVWGQSMVLPTEWVAPYLEWCERYYEFKGDPNDDNRFNLFLIAAGRPVYIAHPSLIEHSGYRESIMGHSSQMFGRPKIAHKYVGDEQSAIEIDWQEGLRPEDRSLAHDKLKKDTASLLRRYDPHGKLLRMGWQEGAGELLEGVSERLEVR